MSGLNYSAIRTSSLLTACYCILLQLCPCLSFETGADGTLPHLERIPVDVTLHINHHPTCILPPGVGNATVGIIQLPVDSLILNVLERASHQHPHLLSGFELVYLHQLGYFVLAINGVAEENQCRWTMMTQPPISLSPVKVGPGGKSVNDVFVSNFGTEITFTFESVGSSEYIPVYDLLGGNFPWSDLRPAMYFVNNPMEVMYSVKFPSHPTCPQPPTFTPVELLVNISMGQTALNVLESGGETDHNLTFTAQNFYGLYYSIKSINVAIQTSSCHWCVKFSPKSDGSVPNQPLPVAINDFVIPVEGGMLTLEYTTLTNCNSAQNSLSQGIITDEVRRGSRYFRSSNKRCTCSKEHGYATVTLGHGLSILFGSLSSIATVVILGRYKQHFKIL